MEAQADHRSNLVMLCAFKQMRLFRTHHRASDCSIKKKEEFLRAEIMLQHRPARRIRSVQIRIMRIKCCAESNRSIICTAPFVWYGFIIARALLFVQCEKVIAGDRFRLLFRRPQPQGNLSAALRHIPRGSCRQPAIGFRRFHPRY